MRSRNQKLSFSTFSLYLVILFCFLATGISSTAWAKDYYVDKGHSNASDSNAGTEDAPFATIQKGANVARAGDTVYVKQGVYREAVGVQNSGAAGTPIVFKAYSGARPVIDGTGIDAPHQMGLFYSNGKSYITLDGFEIRNSDEQLVRLAYGDHLIVRNCLAYNNASQQRQGILIDHCDGGIIENCEVYNTGWNAICLFSASNVVIRNNYVHNNPRHAGVNIFPEVYEVQNLYSGNHVINNLITETQGGIYIRFQTNNKIIGNVIYDTASGYNDLWLDTGRSGQSIPYSTFRGDTLICNNVFAGGGSVNVRNANVTHVTVKNNIMYNAGSQLAFSVTSGHSIDHNLYYQSGGGMRISWGGSSYSSLSAFRSATGFESGGLNANPLFVNASSRDFALQSGSPCIDAGENLSSVNETAMDLAGKARPLGKGFDIGAYEFGSPVILVPPNNLRVVK